MEKKLLFKKAFLLLALFFAVTACVDDESDDSDSEDGDWIRTAPLEGSARSGAASFIIDGIAYVGLGFGNDNQYFTTMYAYDIENGTWSRISDFPGTPRELAASFSVNGKGYVGLGYNRKLTNKVLADFWKYDPVENSWTQLNDFPESGRYSPVAFAIDNRAFVGAGYDGTDVKGDFWEYDFSIDGWTKITTNPGEKKEGAFVFVIDGLAYYGGGRNNGVYSNDFWQFNPSNNSWTKLTPDSDEDYYDEFQGAVRRYDAAAFSLNGKGYVVTGVTSSINAETYEFNPVTGIWKAKTSFEGSSRQQSIAFEWNGKAFLGTGYNGSRRTDDFWQFNPDDDYEEEN